MLSVKDATGIEDLRRNAQGAFERLSWPGPKDEAYRRSDLRFLQNGFVTAPASPLLEIMAPEDCAWTLERAVDTQPELLERVLCSQIPAQLGRFQAWNAQHIPQGAAVSVPARRKIADPIRLRYRFDAATQQGRTLAYFPRNVIHLAQGSQAVVIEDIEGGGEGSPLSVGCTEILLDEGSELVYVVFQRLEPGMRSFWYESAHLNQGAKLHLFHLELGGLARHLEIFTRCAQESSSVKITGAGLCRYRQNFDIAIEQRHSAPRTYSDILWKAALMGRSSNSFRGLIAIEPGANGSQAFEANHNLLLSDHARANPDPRLEILADDVMAKHAATTGHIDEEQLFYLASRGISGDLAAQVLTAAFLKETLQRLADPARSYADGALSANIEENLGTF